MPEDTKEEILIPTFTVNRNGVDFSFDQHKITRGQGESKGSVYPAPTITEENVDSFIKWIGPQAIAGIAASYMKRISQGWNKKVLEEHEGQFDEQSFKLLAASLSVVGETMKVLKARLLDLEADLSKFDVTKIALLPKEDPQFKAFMETAQRIQQVRAAIDNKSRSGKTEADDAAEEASAEPVSQV